MEEDERDAPPCSPTPSTPLSLPSLLPAGTAVQITAAFSRARLAFSQVVLPSERSVREGTRSRGVLLDVFNHTYSPSSTQLGSM
jgi:hypothetical protein